MIDDYALPVLHLRRQAAARGWKLAKRTKARVFIYERHDEDGTHRVTVAAPILPPPGGRWEHDYRPLRVVVNTSDGMLDVGHIGDRQAVGILRAFFGWPPPEVDTVPYPPKSTDLVPVGVYVGGQS